ncbi:homoserine kinase [Candidatus Koribacter versatilis Ellin345]|uniref:Homoserine kinase n=1 Tax=Koribacter versatilis (strain Ellin345) TaxID=204669 RepID=Q1IRL9_KORVE|nr:homoserine kinase [Candidatus Koribacter versatilis]ABF40481.1 homoserine kinase [Candidatus Koribacter versatilis Ellin345]
MSALAERGEIEITVPASVANLGPGFDVLAVAVQLYLRLKVRAIEGRNELRFNFIGQQLKGDNYIERAFNFLARQHSGSFPSLEVDVHCDIPIRSGLGSSAAATVAGLRLYEAIMEPMQARDLLNAAVALEGHPDNVSAALLGGMTASCQLPDGSTSAVSMPWPASLCLIVATPEYNLSTSAARSVLPERVSRHDAVFNLQRMAHLLHALQSEDFSLLHEALSDRLHQPHRQKLIPGLDQALMLDHPDILGVCLSGAGPSIVCFATQSFSEIERMLANIYEGLGLPYQVRTLAVHRNDEAPVSEVPPNEPDPSVFA